jgi:DNA modification methylase
MKVESWEITRPTPYSRNPRRNEGAIAKVAGSLKEFGWRQPIVVDTEGVIIAGHTRLLAAQKLGLSQVPVHIATDLSPQQIKAYRLADNRVAQEAEWDNDLLKLELSELDEEGFRLDLTGFSEDELEALLAEGTEDGLTDEDETPEVEEEAITLEGDLWILGKHRLRCGDSTNPQHVERLMDGKKADMVFTDPPYGVNYDGGHFHSGDVNIKRKREKLANDADDQIYANVIPLIASFCDGPCYTWFAGTKPLKLYQAVEAVGQIHALIIWHKINATYASMNAQYKQRHEPCLYWKPKGSTLRWCGASTEVTIWEMKRDATNNFHPTQKPVELAERAIRNHKAQVVLDLFGGSGSTLIACEKTARDCRIMELDALYVDVAVRRWQQFTGKEAILESSGKTFAEVEAERKA